MKENEIDLANSTEVKRDEEIEHIAWEIFLRNTGLRFTRELTPEEKKSISDVPDYDYYRSEAKKHYEKKQRALLNKKYPVIEVPASGERSWYGGAYCLCFVYSKYNGNFVLKGYSNEVKNYLEKNYTHYICNMSFWNCGFSRNIWYFWKKEIGIFEPSNVFKSKKYDKKFKVRQYSYFGDGDVTTEEKNKTTLEFKRMPKRWIPEFDNF